ncbi:glycosyltransferase family 9 protein [Micromonospora mirobrigensis]|uniref:ADP-heptose:LPS heptosyltransferase n=1 Tax=Micromonospora mirobrigensis TaxID=262898 RepID=A0A1C4ZCH1_9ACTN|nr:glycosyltransferase family 9 protein [Micromonospora mirobrigensis]SCF30663.1 ADP-heptose:LPS heptosyltransferase [Micromonospora mirobrigensis]
MILVLRALGVGDLATGVPALRALRTAYPEQELALVAPAWLDPLVDLVGGIDRRIHADGLGPLPWTGPAPQIAVNLHGRGPQSHRTLAATRPRRMLAFANPDAGHHDGPVWDDDEHEVHRWCRLLARYGIPADPGDLALLPPSSSDVPAGVTVVHPGSKIRAKRWPTDRFAALARELTGRGHRVVVTGSADERDLAGRVAARAGLAASAVLAGRTDVGELAALVARARLVVSGDTGVAHLATGYGTPSVVLFGPVPPGRWGPPSGRSRHRVLTANDGEWTGGAGVGTPSTMAAIPLGRVLAAVDEAEQAVRTSGAVAA